MKGEIYIDDGNIQKALADISKYEEGVRVGVSQEILATAYRIVNKAKNNLTTNKSVKTGNLRAQLKVVNDMARFQAKAGTDVNYAAYVEFGTPAHLITVKNKKVLAKYIGTSKGKEGFIIFGKTVHHPGSKAKPFLFPAAESERTGYTERIQKLLNGSK